MLLTTALRFGVTGLAQLTASPAWEDAAGIVGLVLCAVALHAAAAMVLEDALGRHEGGRPAPALTRPGSHAAAAGSERR